MLRVLVLLLPAVSAAAKAEMSITDFLNRFTENYYQQRFIAQTELIKNNKQLVPKAVSRLIEEAFAENKSFEERMYLLNIASAMAYMQRHLHGDGTLLAKIDPIIKKELDEERKRNAELMKWKKEEQFLGNFVMKRHESAMKKAGLSPVLYPHWKHRLFFECKVCHDTIFRMQRWVNGISHEKMEAGQQCGRCHDGKLSFGVKEQCERCHIAGKPEAEKLHNPDLIDHARTKAIAKKFGAQWYPENLTNGRLPLDRFGLIDWLKMKRDKVFIPVASLESDVEERTRDNKILFLSKSNFVNNVLFDHKIHSEWIDCATCHPAIFLDELGGNDMKMRDMSKGRHCGHCHGKVSFKFADCKRCHSQKRDERVDALIRPGAD